MTNCTQSSAFNRAPRKLILDFDATEGVFPGNVPGGTIG